jgi:hypothetical protein
VVYLPVTARSRPDPAGGPGFGLAEGSQGLCGEDVPHFSGRHGARTVGGSGGGAR